MKAVYRADAANGTFTSSDVVADDYQLKGNETFENPSGKVAPAKLIGTSWQDATPEEHEAWLKKQQAKLSQQVAGPSVQDQAVNALGLQVASLTKENQDLKKSVNTLGLQVAQVVAANKQSTTEKEGN